MKSLKNSATDSIWRKKKLGMLVCHPKPLPSHTMDLPASILFDCMIVESNVVSCQKTCHELFVQYRKQTNKQIVGKLTGEPNYKLLTLQKPRFFIPYQLWLIGTCHQWPVSSNESSSVWLSSLWKGIILWFIFQATLLQVLEYHVEWLEEIGFSHNQVITN